MPVANVRYTSNQFGLPSVAGLNDQIGFMATNNSGVFLRHGDVVVFDARTSVNTNTALVNAQFSLTQATQTLTMTASTAAFPAAGTLTVMGTIQTGGPTVPIFIAYTGIAGSTFTGATASVASITNGVAANAVVDVPPNFNATTALTAFSWGTGVGMPTAPSDGGRLVTLSGLANDPTIAGVVSVDGTAGTATTGQMGNALSIEPGFENFAGAKGVIPPGGEVFVVTNGVARVQVGAGTVAANALLTTSTIPSQGLATGTIGNLLGIALEAQTAKDANNTIRALIKLG